MPTFVIFSDAADGFVSSANATYATAASSGTLSAATSNATFTVGQSYSSKLGEYSCFEGFLSFDTSSVGGTVSSATLALWVTSDGSATDFTCNVRAKDWGASLTTADWVAAASISGNALRASRSSSGVTVGAYNSFTSDSSFASNVASPVRLIISSARHESSTDPGTTNAETLAFSSADASGTTQDPKLTIVVAGQSVAVGQVTETNTAQTISATPVVVALSAGTVDRFARVTMTATGVVGATGLKVYRSADNATFVDISSQCTITSNGGGSWTVIDKRPHYGSQKVPTYGGTGYYKVSGTNSRGEGTATAVTTVASVDVDIAAAETARAAVLSGIMAGSSVPSSADELYPGYWVLAMAYGYYLSVQAGSPVAQYKTDALTQFNYIVASCTTADGLVTFPGFADILRDQHTRTMIHCAIGARLLRRSGASSDAQTIIDQCDVWGKAFFDNLNSGNPAPTKTFSGWDANNTTGTGNQQAWVGSTAYTAGKIVRPTVGNSRTYRCTTAGTTSSSQPTWPTTAGGTVTDGTVVWTETTKTVACSYAAYGSGAGHPAGVDHTSDLNQNAEEAFAFTLLVKDSTSDFFPAGTYHTKAQNHVADAVDLILVHETSTGAIPLGESSGETATTCTLHKAYDTLYGNYVLENLAAVQALYPTLNTYLSGYVTRALNFAVTNYYGTEPISSVRFSATEPGTAGAAFYDLVYLDAAATAVGGSNPQSKLVWTNAFQIPSTDKVGTPYTATGEPATTIANAAQAEIFEGPAVALVALNAQRVNVGLVTETDTANSIRRTRFFNVGLASETSLAQALTHARSRTLGLVTETALAQTLSGVKTRAVGLVTESSLARTLTGLKQRLLGQATETDTALSIPRTVNVGLVTETDTANGISVVTSEHNDVFGDYRFRLDSPEYVVRLSAPVYGFRNETPEYGFRIDP